MSKLSFRLLAFAVAIALTGTVIATADDDAATLHRISGYRHWTKVNPEPVVVPVPVNIDPGFVAD